MPELRVHLLPELVAPEHLTGGTCVVIDVLRATTTIVFALAAGAKAVVPCLTIDEARRRAGLLPDGQAVLGGERGGVKIDGFDLGNSPAEYSPAIVGEKTVVLTTTNGTKALLHCRAAEQVLIAGFVNLSAVCAELAPPPLPLGEGRGEGSVEVAPLPHPNSLPKGEQGVNEHSSQIRLICAGTDGEVTREDVLLAGAIAARLSHNGSWNLNDEAAIAQDAWLRLMAHAAPSDIMPRLVDAMRASQGGRNLIALGMQRDIELAADVDRVSLVPRFDAASGRIEA